MKKNSELIARRQELESREGTDGWKELMEVDAEISERANGRHGSTVTAEQLDRLFPEGK